MADEVQEESCCRQLCTFFGEVGVLAKSLDSVEAILDGFELETPLGLLKQSPKGRMVQAPPPGIGSIKDPGVDELNEPLLEHGGGP